MTPMTIGENELLPCPFCGSAVELQTSKTLGDKLFVIACNSESPCLGSGLGIYLAQSQKAEAIAAWNRRKDGLGTVGANALQWVLGQRTAEATVPFGEYQVAEYTETDGMGYVATFNDALELGEFARSDEAMSACQSDFETRVKSCLTSIGVEAGK